jgi:phage shock protein C
MTKRWYRIKKNAKLGGICAGLSEMLDVDVTLIRFLWFMTIWTPFPAVLSYIIAWFIVPDKEELHATTSINTSTSRTGNKEFLAG